MDAAELRKLMTKVQTPPRQCKIIRTFTNFADLPAHVKCDKELITLIEDSGTDFHITGIIFKPIDPMSPVPVKYHHGGRGPYGPKCSEQCNWTAYNKFRAIMSYRSLAHGSGLRVKIGADPPKRKKIKVNHALQERKRKLEADQKIEDAARAQAEDRLIRMSKRARK